MFAQVASELGQQCIVQSFMTLAVGGTGTVWDTLAGADLHARLAGHAAA